MLINFDSELEHILTVTQDPGTIVPIRERRQQGSALNSQPRAVSSPLQLDEIPSFRKLKSPNAVEFPQSARLKPLDLGNPFHRPVPSQPLKRRATLPSLVLDDLEAGTLANAYQARSTEERPAVPRLPQQDYSNIGLAVTCAGSNPNRRSRSADDSRVPQTLPQALQPRRDRNEEIDYWRKSYNGSLLRHSAAVSGVSALSDYADQDGSTPLARVSPLESPPTEQIHIETAYAKPQQMHDSPLMSRSVTAGGDYTAELEARVNKLEQELCVFRSTLQQYTSQANRQPITLDTSFQPQQTSTHNSPSALVNDLESMETKKNNTVHESVPPRTFTALYNIISSERSARRILENEIRSLRDDLSEVKYHLSQPVITRESSAYMAPLQRQQHRVQSQQYRSSQHTRGASGGSGLEAGDMERDRLRNTLMSRFSLTDSIASSEAARMKDAELRDLSAGRLSLDEADEGITPREMYKTPTAEAGPGPWGRSGREEDVMF